MATLLLAGSTGLIGQAIIQHLPAKQRALLLSRRPLNNTPENADVLITDFSDLHLPAAESPNDAFLCALGTTIKTAGSKAAFEAVDLTLVVDLAKRARAAGYGHFLVVSSLGTTPTTGNFYLQTKAKMEAAVTTLGFESVSIFRPSLLLGERDEFRLGERVADWLSKPLRPLFVGKMRRYLPIHANTVAKAMLQQAAQTVPGVHIIESEQIRLLAGE